MPFYRKIFKTTINNFNTTNTTTGLVIPQTIKTVAANGDYFIGIDSAAQTYKISKTDLLAGLTQWGGSTTTSVDRTFVSNGDANGVLYYVGTGNGTRVWQNPHNSGLILTASSVTKGSLPLLSDRAEGEFHTNDAAGSWVRINLGGARLKCNRYSIRNRNADLHYLRNWKLQGSNDGTNWVDLDAQVNNTFLVTPSQWLSLPVTSNVEYSNFRLLITGVNSSNAYYICLGELELYGLFTP
ncbi:MAG TPA: hypothetical protein VE944_19395 [Nostoc sp.]|uniref:hypothetical protein n=1 Tax=Nostoc sp. TaxID=1180 RepID=UPI002D2DEC99|nr:hypothetical protein [Nostoc sp.]HYX16488.1 hypothetical protein [Nostoc sp.]